MAMCHHPEISEHYLIWDGDTLMLQPLQFFTPAGKTLIKPSSEHHRPYFMLMEKVLGYDRQVNFSFVSEHLMVNRAYMSHLIDEIASKNQNQGSWIYTILDNIDDKNLPKSGFSEYETYGNFIQKNYPDSYECRAVKSSRAGVRYAGKNPKEFDLYSLSKRFLYVTFESHHRFSKKLPLFKLRSWVTYVYDSIVRSSSVKTWHRQWYGDHGQYI